MNRRSFLAGVGAAVVLPGCTSLGREPPQFRVLEPTVEQGEQVVIEVEASNVERLSIAYPEEVGLDSGPLQYEDVTFTPAPDRIWTGFPASYHWRPAKNIHGEIVLQSTEEMPSGSYELSITMRSSDFEDEQTKKTTVTITEKSD